MIKSNVYAIKERNLSPELLKSKINQVSVTLSDSNNIKLDTTNFDGNLDETITTVQELADAVDNLVIPDAQIQSDWNQSDNTAKDYIKNKPTVLGKVWKYKIADNWWFSGSTSVLPFDGDAINSIRDYSNTTYLDVPGAAGIFTIPETGYYTINSALLIMPGYQDTFETQMLSVFHLKVMKNASEAGKLDLFRVAYKDAVGTGANYWNTLPYLAGEDTFYFEADDLVSVNIEAVAGTFNNQILFKYARLVIKKELL